jgi:hypothetical protein
MPERKADEYPKWKYSPKTFDAHAADGNGRVVGNPDEEKALGPGWYDSPADFPKRAEAEKTTGKAATKTAKKG